MKHLTPEITDLNQQPSSFLIPNFILVYELLTIQQCYHQLLKVAVDLTL